MFKRILPILGGLALAGILAAVFLSGLPSGESLILHFFNTAENQWQTEEYETGGDNLSLSEKADLALYRLPRLTEVNPDNRSLPSDIILAQSIQGTTYTVRFTEDYNSLPQMEKGIALVSVIYTLTEIPGIENVLVYAGEYETPLLGGAGPLDRTALIYNSELIPNNFGLRTITLYFANAAGTELVAVERQVQYQPNIENHVIEELIIGPDSKELLRLLPGDASLRDDVTVDGGICYVDFSADFLTQYTDEGMLTLAVSSIVNTLLNITSAQQVQLLFGGDKTAAVHSSLDLGKPLSVTGN